MYGSIIQQKSIELAEKKQLLQDYKIKSIEEREKFYSVLNESLLNLKAQIKIWENHIPAHLSG